MIAPRPSERCPQCEAAPWKAHLAGCYWATVWGDRSRTRRRVDWQVVAGFAAGLTLGVLVGVVYTVALGS